MSDSFGSKFNRKVFQIRTHLNIKDKTYDGDLRDAKNRVVTNRKLFQDFLVRVEKIPDQTFIALSDIQHAAEMIGDTEVADIIAGIQRTGFEELKTDLIFPLHEHIAQYTDIQRRMDECHILRVDMDRHKAFIEDFKNKPKKQEKVKAKQLKYDAECDRYSILQRETIARPIMSSILLGYTTYLDEINKGWVQIRKLLESVPPNFKYIKETQEIVPTKERISKVNPPSKHQTVSEQHFHTKTMEPKQINKNPEVETVQDNELGFNEGDIIQVIEQKGEWWYGKCQNRKGYFPSNYVRQL
ncbi:SH3 domain-containing protein [Entamoeba marina]